ncbi:ESSS subunit of NADH:ubiquinone oxidoreductase-domain-containing protein [Syncephalis plumigaleata]|nr:ESSS subunit of NADH:ubiquinone oxidoreductase-domain-containing protein [Syncephalis plumigaleata]
MASLLRTTRCVGMIRPLHASMRSNLPVTRRYASGEPQYNEPTGYLFNEKPTPGKKRVREDWEIPYIYGGGAILIAASIALYYKPKRDVSTWAYEEARQRMEMRGDLPTYERTDPRA